LPEEKPVVYIFHGDDQAAIQHAIDDLFARMGDPAMADLNTTRLDGRQASEEDLRTAVLAPPFLIDRRLVIFTNPLTRLATPSSRERFLKLLDALPTSTALILSIEDQQKCAKTHLEWDVVKSDGWLMKWAQGAGKRVHVKPYALPDARSMPSWIEKHARETGGKFTPEAAQALAEHTGNATALAEQEIAKLLTYVDGQRPVEVEDVELLVLTSGPVNVFKMVEALADRDSRQALRLLHALLADNDPSHLFGLIVRQFRFLVQVREILDEGGDITQVMKEVRHITFARQCMAQARRFTQAELDAIHHRLLELDEGMKTSQVPADLALEMLVAEIAH
jgi:DNA polymerase-3 subunit delta